MDFDPYGTDVLAAARARPIARPPEVAAEQGLVVEDAASGFCGAITRVEGRLVELEDYFGAVRAFPLDSSFLIDGRPVALVLPTAAPTARARTASGSFAVEQTRARVARSSRILVEGRHDAELVEKVWGADLRVEGVVVEYLEGIDDLPDLIAERDPSPAKRLGVLVDHLVPGSKEQRIADAVAAGPFGDAVLVVGHPFIDIWQAVKPSRLGIEAWPVIPRGTDWKRGICRSLGWAADDQADIARAWQTILGRVRSFADLEPALLGRVEQLIDFVTEPGSA
ncbi:DUF3097 domain-containing protein [Ruicaihuangia caeni]|uniref:DUF3097 domain-containing protein n=1 Tax=Ruicaihuangia caeni TaxID=3042517 RepID=A0AAW6T2U9_9MICO|nr:DUF3097 domain-containing protein [Klugiella sp. YN-L-19]MDI2097754.1 DUF3097 domain-containing protein [Klugiella sp. YN-L-19]